MLYKISLSLFVSILTAYAQRVPQSIPSLKRVEVPKPANLSTYVRDQSTLIALGKALFWDLQVGSDGKIACASCHFHAGADHRLNNQLSGVRGGFPLNYRLTAADFPFHQLSDPSNKSSQVLRDSTYRAGSAGMFARKFDGLIPGLTADEGADVEDPTFRMGTSNLRQVGDRNAPSVIQAIIISRIAGKGRAMHLREQRIRPVGHSRNSSFPAAGNLKGETLRLERSSLTSQSVGPVLNLAEMSYNSRDWPRIGKNMPAVRPPASQRIAADDGVLGRFANARGVTVKVARTGF